MQQNSELGVSQSMESTAVHHILDTRNGASIVLPPTNTVRMSNTEASTFMRPDWIHFYVHKICT